MLISLKILMKLLMRIIKILLLLMSLTASAQQFTVSGEIKGVEKNGPHAIYVGADFRLLADDIHEDIRILDSKGNYVPHFIAYGANSVDKNTFISYPILSRVAIPSDSSFVVIENIKGGKMEQITLAVANTDAVKRYSISGSNDQKQWFGLVNSALLDNLTDPSGTQVYRTLYMPQHSYKYIKVEFNDKKTLPVNVLDAGMPENIVVPQPMQEIKPVQFSIAQEGKKTIIHVKYNHDTYNDRIVFDINGPSFYKRSAEIQVERQKKHKRKTRKTINVIETLELDSSTKNSFDFLHLREKGFTIVIDNKDNPPLSISSVKFFQAPLKLVADLKAGEKYKIVTGDRDIPSADYDLEAFKDKLPADLPVATIAAPKAIATQSTEDKKTNPWIMWACIAVGAAIVLYFSLSLVKDMKNKEAS